MRSLLITLSLLLLSSPLAYGNTQYSEAACMLLDQQIQRFSHQPQHSSYRHAKREYDRYCHNPQPNVPRVTKSRYTATVTPQPISSAVVTNVIESTAEAPDTKAPDTKAPDGTELAELTLATAVPAEYDAAAATAAQTTALPTPDTKAELQRAPAQPQPVMAEPAVAGARTEMAAAGVAVVPQRVLPASDAATVTDDVLIQILNNLPLLAANIFALLLAVFLLTSWFGLNLPGFKGVFAEYKLNRLLRWGLSRRYQHFRKLKLLTAKDELVVIDHLVLSPFGIFVIAVKSYRGRIGGSETAANWSRQYFGSNKQFMNPLHQNFKNVEAVRHLLQLPGNEASQPLHSVIAFSRVGQFNTDMPAQVTYVDTATAYLKQFSDPCLSDEQVNRFSALLGQATTGQ